MFYYVFYKNYRYEVFIKNKIINIGIPYFTLATIAILITYLSNSGYFNASSLSSYNYRDGIPFEMEDSVFTTTLKYYTTGRFLMAYWYIPFALLLFATAPIHIIFIHLRGRLQVEIIILLSLISIFGHRPVGQTNPFQALIYYTPIYLIGILVAMNRRELKPIIQSKIFILTLIALVMFFSMIQYSTGHIGNYNKPFLSFDGIDFMYLQKISLVFLIYSILECYSFESYLLDVISKTSFSIFFIHPWLIVLYKKVFEYLGFGIYTRENDLFLYITMLILVVSTSVLIALSVKKAFRGSSKTRYIVGY